MSPIGRVFPQIYSVSFYNFMLKTLAVVAYAVILCIIFGFFISNGESNKKLESDGGGRAQSGHALMTSVQETPVSNQVVITRLDVNRAKQGPKQTVEVTNEKLDNVDLSKGTPDILFRNKKRSFQPPRICDDLSLPHFH